MLPHLHYSPYKFSTGKQMAEEHKKVVREKKLWIKMCEERKHKTHNLGATMPIEVAHEITSRPNAFIAPNLPDVMRQSKAVFGAFQD